MYTNFPLYPTSIFSNTDYPAQVDNTDTVYAALINALKTEMQACFDELGILPKGSYISVKERLKAISIAAGMAVASPISQWKMNDNLATTNAIDSVDSNNGTAQQNTDQLDTTGKINGALTFNGTSDYIDVGDQASLDFTTAFSFAGWVNLASGADDHHEIVSKKGYRVWVVEGDGKIVFRSDATYTSTGNITFGEWQHIAVTISNKTVKVYINGVYDSTFTLGVTVTGTSGNNFMIGRYSYSPDNFTEGALDDIRMYGVALSADDISMIWNLGNGTEDKNPL